MAGAGGGSSPQQEKKLFPIFRPKAERKVLYIIRHGESEFNAATNTGKGFSDPQIYDPKLTAKGQNQVGLLQQVNVMLCWLHRIRSLKPAACPQDYWDKLQCQIGCLMCTCCFQHPVTLSTTDLHTLHLYMQLHSEQLDSDIGPHSSRVL